MNFETPVRILATDFRSGEISPSLLMRVDSKIYASGAKSLKNMLLRNTGSIERRPGTEHRAVFVGRVRLVPFEYDEDEKYVLAFSVSGLKIYQADGTLIQSFSGSSDCPWDNFTTIKEMTHAQAADVMVLCHRSFKPRVLTRTGISTFSMSQFAFTSAINSAEVFQPYLKFEAANVTLARSGHTGAITVTASAAIFSNGWVGDRIRINGVEVLLTAYTSSTVMQGTAQKAIEKRLDNNPFLITNLSSVIEVTDPFHGLVTGSSVTIEGAVATSMRSEYINGTFVITVIDEDHYSYVSSDTANRSQDDGGAAVKARSLAATRDWDEQVFSTRRGWPGAVCFHEDRLWFGGSDYVPDGIWSSRTGFYFDFDVGDGEADASIQVSVGPSGTRIANIKHLLSNRVLQVFTGSAEYVAKQSDGVGLTPDNFNIRNQTTYGSSYLAPMVFDGATIFLQNNSKTIREFVYEFNQDSFQSSDISMLSSHLINAPFAAAVVYGTATRPEQYAIFVNTDGTIAVFHSIRSEGLAAWVPWETKSGDSFDGVVVLGNRVFFSVLRSGTYRMEELMLDDDVWLDGCLSLTAGSPATSWDVSLLFSNETVKVNSGDYYLGEYTVASGSLTVDHAVEEICAGYDYGIEVIPTSPDMQLADGPMTGRRRRISSVLMHVLETLSLKVNDEEIIACQIGSDFSDPPARLSGKKRVFLRGHDRDPVYTVTQSAPLPVTIAGIVMEIV